jgi:5,10-methylenetetrahydrofolate reductase
MIDEVRSFGGGPLFEDYPDFRIGTVSKLGRDLAWRRRADFVFVQITHSLDRLFRWRESLDFEGKMYAGVLVLASSRMALRINASIPDIRVPSAVIDKLDDDPEVGLDLACQQIEEIRASGAFDGVHLVPVTRYRQMAERLAELNFS